MIRPLACLMLGLAISAQAADLESFKATKTNMPVERLLEGSVEAISHATVSAETGGRVEAVIVDIGDHVPAGKVILKLVGIDQKESMNQAQAAVREARAMQESEEKQFKRVQALFSKNQLSKADFDTSTARLNSAKARLSSAEAALNLARQQVEYTEIKAAYTGVVSARHVEIGEAVRPGMPLMSGFDPDHLRVFVDLPQSVVDKLKQNPSVRVLLSHGEVEPVKVSFFPTADPATGTVRMRLELPEAVEGVYPGQLVKVAVKVGEKARLLVPVSSVAYRSEVAGVYVLNEKRPTLRQVRVGNQFNHQIEILAGLEADEIVAADPVAAGIVAAKLMAKKGD